jgi:hypothetical protein
MKAYVELIESWTEGNRPRIQRATGTETRRSVSEKHVATHNIQEFTYVICIRD